MEKDIKYIRVESYEPDKVGFIDSSVIQTLKNNFDLNSFNLDNIILGVITHSFDNCSLPIAFDAVFNDNTYEEMRNINIVIRGCFNFGKKFHTELWKGYNHLAIIDFTNGVPDFFRYLKPNKVRKRWSSNYFICQSNDLEDCKIRIENTKKDLDKFMQTKNNDIWVANNKEEFEHKKIELIDLIEKFERGQIEFNSLQLDIAELTGKTMKEHELQYWTYTSLTDFCERLVTKPIKDWKDIDDTKAIDLIKEMLDNILNDGILERNGEALEKKYNKVTGFVCDLIFHSDLNNEIDILEKLKINTTIYL